MIGRTSNKHPVLPVHFDGVIYSRQTHGGVSRVFDCLFHELVRYPDLAIYLHTDGTTKAPQLASLPDCIHRVSLPDVHVPSRSVFPLWNKQQQANAARQRHWAQKCRGVFHSTYYTTYFTPGAVQILTLHDMTFEDFPECFPDQKRRDCHIAEKRRCILAADVIVCVSQATKDRLVHHYGSELNGKSIEVVYNGVAPVAAPPEHVEASGPSMRLLPGSPYIAHVGSRYPHKNFNRLLSALAAPQLSRFHLLSVGGGAWSDEEAAHISRLNLTTRIHSIPRASDHELDALYRCAKALVVPSLDEGFGLPVLEALARGCRVASSRAGALQEVGGELAEYFDPRDVDGMVRAIRRCVDANPDDDFVALAKRRAAQFTWTAAAESYAALYRREAARAGSVAHSRSHEMLNSVI